MKKIIILFLLFLLPFKVYGGFYCSGEFYKIVKYNNINQELTFKWGGIYDKFLNGPILSTKNIEFVDSHYEKGRADFCHYKNFEKLNKLKFQNLIIEDKIIFILNLFSTFFIIIFIFVLFYLGYKKNKSKNYKSFRFYKN